MPFSIERRSSCRKREHIEGSRWTISASSLTSPAKGERENVWISVPDGVDLAARIWLPEDADEDPVPAILEYLPYRSGRRSPTPLLRVSQSPGQGFQ
ncbi:CocE/NonD family hydrolase [Rhizobium mongolense]|uniref:CocE/NonD family hydrolase n=1 Tax=Rhizobium mongolense TaxID=57676 RepID=UPI003F5E343B